MGRYAFIFPGQGAQFPGMGKTLADSCAESREVFATADRVLDEPISRLCFEGGEDELALTENTQPAILTVSVAALRALEQRGLVPSAAAGHSLGEYSAHVAAGTLAFEDAVRVVRLRGRFMQEAVPVGIGAMAAILGLDPADVARLCEQVAGDQVVSAANINAPAQVVIAGHAAAVERAVAAAREAGAKRAIPLAVSAPFHCSLMQPAADRLKQELEAIPFNDPRIPVFTNVDARPVTTGEAARDALIRQVASPVRWVDLIRAMLDDGIERYVEVGPGKVLAGLMRGVRKRIPVHAAGEPEGVEKAATEIAAAEVGS